MKSANIVKAAIWVALPILSGAVLAQDAGRRQSAYIAVIDSILSAGTAAADEHSSTPLDDRSAPPQDPAARADADDSSDADGAAGEHSSTPLDDPGAPPQSPAIHADADDSPDEAEPAADYDYEIPLPAHTGVKNVAVVETEIDAQSGAAEEMTSADVRLVTAELRREAVKNLPRGRYNVMTSETVYAQGSAVLEVCTDENCVIKLGNAIGADYIVRGVISKFRTRFTLTVEMYETEDGNLVASSEPVRSESIGDLLEKAAEVCSDMYKTFVDMYAPPPEPDAPPPEALPLPPPPSAVQEPESPLQKLQKAGLYVSVGAGGLTGGGYGGGIAWNSGERVKMPYSVSGAYLFLDAVYAELSVGYSAGDGKWESPNAPDPRDLPKMPRSYINIGALAKYPVECLGRAKLFPLVGFDYAASVSGKIKYSNGGGEYPLDGANGRSEATALSSTWFKFGGGIDFDLGKFVYLRAALVYGLRSANEFEQYCVDTLPYDVSAEGGQGLDFRIGVGIRL